MAPTCNGVLNEAQHCAWFLVNVETDGIIFLRNLDDEVGVSVHCGHIREGAGSQNLLLFQGPPLASWYLGDGFLERVEAPGPEPRPGTSRGTHHSSRVLQEAGSCLWMQRERGLS